ncbi:MAG TPA: c-type cytochrome, partial [Rhizobiales bacterium]|nr:c-type cytochrome [Hyphomicrobiales bacterium]
PPIPADNPMSAKKIKLGKMLFWDPRLGGDASTACVTCHEPDQGWAFSDSLSRGYPGTVHWRNSQTVINSAYLKKQFWAGAAASNEKQAPSAAKGAVAGNGENDVMEARLAFIPEYRKLFKEVFGTEWPLIGDAWRAIAAFERTLIVKDTPVDRYLAGDKKALNAQQIRGMKLFNGKAGCIRCHNGPLASDEKYYNIGVPAAERWQEDGLAQITFRYEQYAKGVTQEMYRKIKDDAGFYYRSKEKADMGKFRTAPLRYLKYTAPYMHNGSFWDLKEVVEFYNAGGGTNIFTDGTMAKTKSPLMKPLGLTDKEVDDVVAFLEAFSGEPLKVEAPKLPAYAPLPNPATN